jgi:sec-independent protein translocase protein TatC
MSKATTPDPDDFFSETRMSFGDHIEDLRSHLWKALIGFGVGLFLSFFIGHRVLQFITAPIKAQLEDYYNRRQAKILADKNRDILGKTNVPTPFRSLLFSRKQLKAIAEGKDPTMHRPKIVSQSEREDKEKPKSWWARAMEKADKWVGEGSEKNPIYDDHPGDFHEIREEDKDKELVRIWVSVENPPWFAGDLMQIQRAFLETDSPTTLRVEESFMVWFKVCIVCGIILGSPWIFYQIWMFVAAGLYPSEKRLVHVYLPVSLGLFIAGVLICQFLVIPKAIQALLWFNEWVGAKADVRLNEWLGFAIFMPLVFGISFQTPLVMLFLGRLGIMSADSFRNKRRMAWFVMAVFAAVITPSVDAMSMLFLWVPMSLLFELGILLIKLSPPPPELDVDIPEPDELVEV